MLNLKKVCCSIAISFPLLLSTQSVGATTVGECDSMIQVLSSQWQGTEITSKNENRVRDSLQSKIDAASLKLSQAKFLDSIQKLNDFSFKVEDLGTPNRKGESAISVDDSLSLQQGASDAASCVGELLN